MSTAVIVAPASQIGYQDKDIRYCQHDEGLGSTGKGLGIMIADIQTGKKEFEGESVVCGL